MALTNCVEFSKCILHPSLNISKKRIHCITVLVYLHTDTLFNYIFVLIFRWALLLVVCYFFITILIDLFFSP